MSQNTLLIQEVYKDYTAAIDVKETVQIFLHYVPPEDLVHLQFINLTNMAALSRGRKRKRGSLRASISDVLGRCFQTWKGQPAYIEIYVNNILSSGSWEDLNVPILRKMMFARVLYHEIGHHV